MARLTRAESLQIARRAIDIEKRHHEYTIIIGWDNNFKHMKWRVFPANIRGGDVSTEKLIREEFKKFLGNNIITFTSEELSRSMENTQTIKGLDDTLYIWVNTKLKYYTYKNGG